jgi:hypothetical protein
MRTEPIGYDDSGSQVDPSAKPIDTPAGLGRRVGSWLLHELREILPPTIFFLSASI